MKVVWDEAKNRRNCAKHGVSFGDAGEVFLRDDRRFEMYDVEHSDAEDRFIAIGPSGRGVLAVVYVEPDDDVIRIISARRVTKREMRQYLAFLRARA